MDADVDPRPAYERTNRGSKAGHPVLPHQGKHSHNHREGEGVIAREGGAGAVIDQAVPEADHERTRPKGDEPDHETHGYCDDQGKSDGKGEKPPPSRAADPQDDDVAGNQENHEASDRYREKSDIRAWARPGIESKEQFGIECEHRRENRSRSWGTAVAHDAVAGE